MTKSMITPSFPQNVADLDALRINESTVPHVDGLTATQVVDALRAAVYREKEYRVHVGACRAANVRPLRRVDVSVMRELGSSMGEVLAVAIKVNLTN